ncbi:MAG: hypothetical protein ACM359_11785 [Bacillota bacterium]
MSCQRGNKDCLHAPVAETRRDFLRDAVRYVAAGGLISGMSLLVLGRSESSAAGDCVKPIACGGCDAFGVCDLPRALAAKQRVGK